MGSFDRDTIESLIPRRLLELPFYKRMALLMEWLFDSGELWDIDALKNFYDTDQTQSIQNLERLTGSESYIDIFRKFDVIVSERERRDFMTFMKMVYQMKGTKRGIQLIMTVLGFRGVKIHEWFSLNKALEEIDYGFPLIGEGYIIGDSNLTIGENYVLSFSEFPVPQIGDCHEIGDVDLVIGEPAPKLCGCSVVLEMAMASADYVGDSLAAPLKTISVVSTFEDDLKELLSLFMHACVRLAYVLWNITVSEEIVLGETFSGTVYSTALIGEEGLLIGDPELTLGADAHVEPFVTS